MITHVGTVLLVICNWSIQFFSPDLLSDVVSVVVSEETGRISIAYNGEIESYSSDNFYKAFVNIMSETDVLSADASTGGDRKQLPERV